MHSGLRRCLQALPHDFGNLLHFLLFHSLPNSYSLLAQRARLWRRHVRCTTLMFTLILPQLGLVPSSQGTPPRPLLASDDPEDSLVSRARPDPGPLPLRADSRLFAPAQR